MKTSNKILLTIIVCVVLAILLLAIVFRMYLHPFATITQNDTGTAVLIKIPKATIQESSSTLSLQNIDLKNIDRVKINGITNVKIVFGKTPSIKSADGILPMTKITKNNNELNINGIKRSNLIVTLPIIKNLDINGISNVILEDFQIDYLNVRINGMSSLTGNKNKITNLQLSCPGKSNVNLKNSKVVNATINTSGLCNITLTMNGGNLTGQASGMSSITYYGEVKNRDIETSGVSRVNKVE